MKLTVTKNEIKNKLALIQNIVEKSGSQPILSHFLLTATAGKATITATDLTISIREPLEATIEAEGIMCIPARKLLEIVRESDADIILEAVDPQWVSIKSGKSKFKLACLPHGEFPLWPEVGVGSSLIFKGADLSQIIEKTLFCAGQDDTRYTLNGLLFDIIPESKTLAVVGTDGHRLAVSTKDIDYSGQLRKLILPRKAASELLRLLSDEAEIIITLAENNMGFRIGEIEFLARLIEGTYPNYEQVLPKGNDKHLTVDTALLTRAIRKTSLMSKEGNNTVVFNVEAKTLTVSSAVAELGEATDVIEVEYSAEPIKLGFNSGYLMDAVSAFKGEKLTLSILGQVAPVLLTNGDPHYRSIVMPIRL
jgi:DNA polymerase-3 subunit beta